MKISTRIKIISFTILLFTCANRLAAQTIELLTPGVNTSLRGLSVVNDHIVWVSGSNGTVGRSMDGGQTFKWITVKGFEKTDFRDIEAFDSGSAIIMGIAEPAYILKTTDGGENWKVVYENKTAGMFLDAMEFWNQQNGIVIGDPIKGKFFIARTFDGGMNWKEVPPQQFPAADSGEACFASSGTNIRKIDSKNAVFVTGGLQSSLYYGNNKIKLPVIQGTQTTGANSVAVKSRNTLIVVGGDFNSKESITKNCFITIDGGKTWKAPQTPPNGYRSCVEWLGGNNWICSGLNGVDYSSDEGNTWMAISQESFHVCRKAKMGKAVFLAGGNGKIGRLRLP